MNELETTYARLRTLAPMRLLTRLAVVSAIAAIFLFHADPTHPTVPVAHACSTSSGN